MNPITPGQQNHPQAILEEALDAGRVPEPLREQYRRGIEVRLTQLLEPALGKAEGRA